MDFWVSAVPVPVLEGKTGINGEETGVPSDASASKLLELVNSCQNEGYISIKEKKYESEIFTYTHTQTNKCVVIMNNSS